MTGACPVIHAVDVGTFEEVREITEANHHAFCKNCWPELKLRRSIRAADLNQRRMPEEVRQAPSVEAKPASAQTEADDGAEDLVEDLPESSVNSSDESSSSEEPTGVDFDGVGNTDEVQKKLEELDHDHKIHEERAKQ